MSHVAGNDVPQSMRAVAEAALMMGGGVGGVVRQEEEVVVVVVLLTGGVARRRLLEAEAEAASYFDRAGQEGL